MDHRAEETQIFVGDLPETVDEQLLFNEFSKMGTILQIKIMRHLVTKKSRGIAYITFMLPSQGWLCLLSYSSKGNNEWNKRNGQ